MDISIRLPLDGDGFLRRQCPHCNAVFKWHHGPANAEAEAAPSPASYFCPLCGEPAEVDRWYTEDQVAYIEGVAMPAVMREADTLLRDAFSGLSSTHIKVTTSGNLDVPGEPDALVEAEDDMVIVASPCHGYEPVKVPSDAGPLHCLICGKSFAV